MPNQKLFFSYSRVDGSAFALRLAVDLKKKGFDVWIDQEDIRAGLDWDTEIEKALESCDCLLFVETEKSVVSNNVLDEVYYAIEQKKKVIPLIYVDSKTPFRLNRLQHIDFTKNYDTGLAVLVNELENNTPDVSCPPEETSAPTVNNKRSFFSFKYRATVIIACIAVLISATIMLTVKSHKTSTETKAITLTDTVAKKKEALSDAPDNPVINSEDKNSKEIAIPVKNTREGQDKKASAISNVNTVPAVQAGSKTENSLNILNEMVAGDWKLIDIEPKAQSHSGYIKIEALEANKVSVKSYMQFYYPDSKATSYLTIFNAFAGCASCAVNKEMKLNVEDIAVASRTIKKLQADQADGKKAGEVISDANSNKSIGGTVILHFTDNSNAVIKVKQPLTIALANELMLEPFVYIFRFKKE